MDAKSGRHSTYTAHSQEGREWERQIAQWFLKFVLLFPNTYTLLPYELFDMTFIHNVFQLKTMPIRSNEYAILAVQTHCQQIIDSYHIIGNIFIDREEVIFVVNESYTHVTGILCTKHGINCILHILWMIQCKLFWSIPNLFCVIKFGWVRERERENFRGLWRSIVKVEASEFYVWICFLRDENYKNLISYFEFRLCTNLRSKRLKIQKVKLSAIFNW